MRDTAREDAAFEQYQFELQGLVGVGGLIVDDERRAAALWWSRVC